MPKTVAVLATLDTKGAEAAYLRERIEAGGGRAHLIDIGVVGEPGTPPDVPREDVAAAGGTPLASLLEAPTRQTASPVMVAGATSVLSKLVDAGRVHAVLGLGGTQGTSNVCEVMRALPYGFPKLMVSTVASGDTSAFVGIKDVTMAFSVSDVLGLNPLTRTILSNAAGAALGMAEAHVPLEPSSGERPVVGLSNLGVLTDGAMLALDLLRERGYEAIVFHAVGSGGRAMEQLMRDGVIGAVLDYAMGEIADDVFDGLRAGGPDRMTVAGELGLPQVIVPGGAEHIGLLVEPNVVPERWREHLSVFHNPIIFAPRLASDELVRVAADAGRRLASTRGNATLMIPLRGVSRYSVEGGPLRDPGSDTTFFAALREHAPDTVDVVEVDAGAEDEEFVRAMVDELVRRIEG